MDLLYSLGIIAYRGAVRLASIRSKKARLMLKGQRQTFKKLRSTLDPAGGYIWMHVASLGEFEQGRPLIEMIKKNNPEARIVLSFFSPSGYEVRKNYPLVDTVVYLPFDTLYNATKFVDIVKPSVAIFVKYEFWGNYLNTLKRRNVPTYIISSIFRPSQSFFKPWGGMFRNMLKCFNTMYVQNEESRKLLADIGHDNVVVCGDTRFDRVAGVKSAAKQFPIIESFVKDTDFTLIMGSSWEPDEEIAMPYFNEHPSMKFIIAPHEFDRKRLLDIMARTGRKTALYSQTSPEEAATLDCLIIDSFGLLSSLYQYGQAAYIGGGFGHGIHNINEAAVYGIPVIFGPKHEKFQEAHDLIECGGGFCISNAEQFNAVIDRIATDKAYQQHCGKCAGDYIESHLGATQVIYDQLKDLF